MPAFSRKKIKVPEPLYIFEAKGCKKCNFKGYSGRTGIFELIEMTDKLAEIIIRLPVKTKILEEARRQGMISMKEDGVLKVLEGITSIEEIMRAIEEE